MKKFCRPTELTNQIHNLRQKLVEVGSEKGLNSPETLTYSQELDKLIYQYQYLEKNSSH